MPSEGDGVIRTWGGGGLGYGHIEGVETVIVSAAQRQYSSICRAHFRVN